MNKVAMKILEQAFFGVFMFSFILGKHVEEVIGWTNIDL